MKRNRAGSLVLMQQDPALPIETLDSAWDWCRKRSCQVTTGAGIVAIDFPIRGLCGFCRVVGASLEIAVQEARVRGRLGLRCAQELGGVVKEGRS